MRFAVLAVLAGACHPAPKPIPPDADTARKGETAHLIERGGKWYITDLCVDAAAMAERGRLFAAFVPLAGTGDREPIAVLKSLGHNTHGGRSVQVAVQCQARHRQARAGQTIERLESATNENVGRCLATVVGQSPPGSIGEWVILNVGSGDGLQPGNEYILLGKPVVTPGQVPSGLDTYRDGRCLIPRDETQIDLATTRCNLTKRPADRPGSLIGVYAAYDTK